MNKVCQILTVFILGIGGTSSVAAGRDSIYNSANVITVYYDGIHNTFDLDKLFEYDPNAGKPSFTIEIEGTTGAGEITDHTLTYSCAGVFKIGMTTARRMRYAEGEKVVGTLTVNKYFGFGSVTLESWTIGQTANSPVASSDANGSESVTYIYEGTDSNGQPYAPSTTPPVNAGNYTVTAKFAETCLYTAYTTEPVDFTIRRAQIVNHQNDSAPRVIEYTGTYIDFKNLFIIDQHAGKAHYSLLCSTGEGEITLDGKLRVTKVGEFTFMVTTDASDDNNYTASASPIINTLTVNKGTGSCTVTIDNWRRDEQPDKPESKSETNGTEPVSYHYFGTTDEGESYDSDEPPSEIGSYTVVAVFAETNLYISAIDSADFEIITDKPTPKTTKSADSLQTKRTSAVKSTAVRSKGLRNNAKNGVNEKLQLRIYPNPTDKSRITISNERLQNGDLIELYSMTGQQVATYSAVGPKTTINIGYLNAGMYIIRAHGMTSKLVKLRQ